MNVLLHSLPNIVFCLIICACKIVEISFSSLKTVFLVKGRKSFAACFAFIECMVWGLIVSGIITDLNNNIYWLLAYCAGYSLGFYFGSIIESKLAIGTIDAKMVVPIKYTSNVEKYLQDNNYGYYITCGKGAEGKKSVFTIIVPRKQAKNIRKNITDICDGNIFVTNFDVTYYHGGYGFKSDKLLP